MLNRLCMLACTWGSMIMGSARSHKPTEEERMLYADVLCKLASPRVRQYACSTAAYEYRPIIMPLTPEANVATGSLHTIGALSASAFALY
jgi:hypothetical protein